MNTKKGPIRLISGIFITISCIVIILIAVVFVIWHNEISTVASIKKISDANPEHSDGAVYTMKVSGDYYFDDFLKQNGAKNDSELISFITGKITKGIIPMNIKNSEIACSAFTASANDGKRIFGRNYDFKKTNTMIVHTKPGNGRHASVSTVDLQFVSVNIDTGITGVKDKILCLAAPYAPLDGVNDAGVSCGIFMSYQGEKTIPTDINTDKPDLTSTTMLRMVLDYADNVDEAVEMIKKYDLHDSAKTSYHYMIADATGKSAVLEWVNGTDSTDNDASKRKLNVIYNDPAKDSNYQIITNYILSDGYYKDVPEKEAHGVDRFQMLSSALSPKNGVIADEEEGMKTLAIVGRRGMKNEDSNSLTIHSVVYNLTDKTALWVDNEHYGEKEHTFVLDLENTKASE